METEARGVVIACVDAVCTMAVRVEPGFNGTRGYGEKWAFDAAWPDEPEWVTYMPPNAAWPDRSVPLLANVVWDADPLPDPSPLLALGAVAALAGVLVAFDTTLGWAGVAAAAGFLAHHGVEETTLLVPAILFRLAIPFLMVAGATLVVGALVREAWRAWLPVGVLIVAFALGAWTEGFLFDGYRPFTSAY